MSDVPGTTRDAIDTVLERGDTTFVLVDTAGLRRKRRQRQGIEYYSELRALEAAERADVALVLVDASEGIVEQDLAVADVARKAGCSTLVVLSKWDIGELDIVEARGQLNRRLRQRPPVIAVSSKTGRGLARVLDGVEDLFDEAQRAGSRPASSTARWGAAGSAQHAVRARPPAQPALRRAGLDAAAALPPLGERPEARHARLRVLGRERAPPPLRHAGRPRFHRLRPALVNCPCNTVLQGVFAAALAPDERRSSAGLVGERVQRAAADRGHDVTLACRDAEQAAAIAETGRNPRYLRELDLSGVAATAIADAPVEAADLVVVAVPSAAYRSVVEALPGDAPVLSLTKGLDPTTGERLSTLVRNRPVAVLSGPNIAEEIARGLPAAAVIASDDDRLAVRLQLAINSTIFRIYVNDDMLGVELCAAAKNVIALAAGGADGLRLGDNAKAGLVSRGLAEMARLAEEAGARPETFAGLAGMGDLIVTCWSKSGRNRRAGELIAQGSTADEARAEIGMVVEGLTTAPVLRDLSRRLGIELPITEGVCAVLEGVSLTELVQQLMGRTPTSE